MLWIRPRSIGWLTSLFILATVAGCATPQAAGKKSNPDFVWAANDTGNFARFAEDFVKRSQLPSEGASAILARAAILNHHAQMQEKLAQACKAKGPSASASELNDLAARAAGLREERMALYHELTVWQVQHGFTKAEDTDLIYVQGNSDC